MEKWQQMVRCVTQRQFWFKTCRNGNKRHLETIKLGWKTGKIAENQKKQEKIKFFIENICTNKIS